MIFTSKVNEILDPGYGVRYERHTKRIINTDGTFNVIRKGVGFSSRNIYQDLIKMSWVKFLTINILIIFTLNALFALLYIWIGLDQIEGVAVGTGFYHDFTQAFFFSFQTFTTLGYGRISPTGDLANLVSAIEAMIGFMSFALITGLLYGRFSKPNISLEYSRKMLIAPYRGGKGLMFRIANKRHSVLVNVKANVTLTLTLEEDNTTVRKYYQLKLERDGIQVFPISWTIVHPIDKDSPFNDIEMVNISGSDLEIMIQIQVFDETFGQIVHSRYSYLSEDIEYGAKFLKSYRTEESGEIILDVRDLHKYEKVNL